MIGAENWSLRGGHYSVKFLPFHYLMGVYYLRMGVLFCMIMCFGSAWKIYLNGPYVCLRLNCAPVYFISYLISFEHKDNTQFEIEGCLAKHVFLKMLWNKIKSERYESFNFPTLLLLWSEGGAWPKFCSENISVRTRSMISPKCLPVVRNASTHSNTNSNCDRDRLSRIPKYL